MQINIKASESCVLPKSELAGNREQLDAAEYQREYECAFTAAVGGAYYSNELEQLREDQRVSDVLHLDQRPVLCAMDVGVNDLSVAWFVQLVGTTIQVINCIAWHDTALKDICRDLRDLPYKHHISGLTA